MIRALVAGLIAICAVNINAQSTTSSVYIIKDGQVLFPNWDSRKMAEPKSLAELGVKDFPEAVVYADRLLLTEKPAKSKVFKIPETATTFTVTARARQVGSIFPRIKVSLVENAGRRHELFNGYWQSVPLETYQWTVPVAARGKSVKLLLEILNPGMVEEQRCWYFLRANIY